MKLLFLGPPERPIFGAYHAPSAPRRGAALICPPWGVEYVTSHRTLRRLASALSERGFDVLRFDYRGTGDSAGGREEGDLASWLEDASLALDELRDMSDGAAVTAIGLRLGAVVAWRLAVARPEVRAAVLWDPVADGGTYLAELEEEQAERDFYRLWPRARRAAGDATVDLRGFPMTPQMRQSILAVTPAEFSAPVAGRVKVFQSAPTGPDTIGEILRAAGTAFDAEALPAQVPWYRDAMLDTGGTPAPVLRRMASAL